MGQGRSNGVRGGDEEPPWGDSCEEWVIEAAFFVDVGLAGDDGLGEGACSSGAGVMALTMGNGLGDWDAIAMSTGFLLSREFL